MNDSPLSTRRQLELMQYLQELADARAQAEANVAATLESELAAAEKEYESRRDELAHQGAHRRRDLENSYAQAKIDASAEHRQATETLEQRFSEQQTAIENNARQAALGIDRKKKESEWQSLAVFDAAKDRPRQMLEAAGKRLHTRRLQIDGLLRDANTLLAMRRLTQAVHHDEVVDRPMEPSEEDRPTEERQQTLLNRLHHAVLELQSQRLPSLMLEGSRKYGWWLAACVFAILPSGFAVQWSPWLTPLAATITGTIATFLAYQVFGRRARHQSIEQYERITTMVAEARQLEQLAQQESETASQQLSEEIAHQKYQELNASQSARDQAIEQNDAKRSTALQQAQAQLDDAIAKLRSAHEAVRATADEKYPPLLEQLAKQRQADADANQQRHDVRVDNAQCAHDEAWGAMAERWQAGYREVTDELAAMRGACDRLFPDWSVAEWSQWQRPTEPPPAVQFGRVILPLQAVKNGLSKDERLVPAEIELELPTCMAFAEQPSLVISAEGAGRRAAVEVMQAMMLRFLTTMPAGKLRMTIIDPSALGENFATFMHLADHDEQLVGGRIWTDSRQIDERLALLSDHMEKVLQKYLRNEFDSIDDYNRHAGEVAEPYHLLVVANFPAGLSDASMRKLATIVATGPRCGVYTLMSIDTSIKLPGDFPLTELLANAVQLEWADDRMLWRYPLFEKLPLKLDKLPPRERFNDLLRAVGEESREASRVEVPFAVVAPAEGQLWTESAAHELVVPVGRAGANELQSLSLGRGTSQHALVSGKTGSGKSTLLHALVTNLAMRYSPREAEVYLVDFKKGVEFKAYATGRLPHARVIAIESEREFGVSVLERLDQELRVRGERFRELGVQDLARAREACDDRLPRILLAIDEFQELFVVDDKLSQDAALLLDRLVRQGRAFGIHVLLGSQTLAGAYSLARSTIGQMAVRVALQCSEADAHLILSDDNPAARLLSRPGEAIYNDQNGLVEGNNLFQVVWLPDAERQRYLAEIHKRFVASGDTLDPAIVFEGNVPADPRDNDSLVSIVASPNSSDVAEPTIWLGSAVRIEPPTQITLRRQSGNHLLIVGQQERLALGILATSACAFAAQQRSSNARLTIFDGTRPESPEQGAWAEVADALPGKVQVVNPREASDAITALANEVARRTESADAQHAPHFVVIHDLAQFRDLRLTEDDFGFSSSAGSNGKQPSIDKQFRNLLREGPAVGVHLLIWCDSYNSLTRSIDRLTLREIDYRIATQISAADSTSLLDSPAACQLGEHRAILYRDDLGTQVKFRPYGRPTSDWLMWVGEQLAGGKLARS